MCDILKIDYLNDQATSKIVKEFKTKESHNLHLIVHMRQFKGQ